MSLGSLIFFAAFVAILFAAYLAIRQRRRAPGLVAFGAVLGGIISMTAFGLAQGNVFIHALLVGLLMGGGFSVAAMIMAFYFQGDEMRKSARKRQE